jgi:hypothetical protein
VLSKTPIEEKVMRNIETLKAEKVLLIRAGKLASELTKLIHHSFTVSRIKSDRDGAFTKVHQQAEWLLSKLIDAKQEVGAQINKAEQA